ncbi:hypothetical protein Bbelb_250420 [Branchiostoma belcheri]|nr:hypothetical protein Bbelb_250420 [Branchiostoma belcheri]
MVLDKAGFWIKHGSGYNSPSLSGAETAENPGHQYPVHLFPHPGPPASSHAPFVISISVCHMHSGGILLPALLAYRIRPENGAEIHLCLLQNKLAEQKSTLTLGPQRPPATVDASVVCEK